MTENNAPNLTPEDAALLESLPEGDARDKLAARLAATYEGATRTPRPDANQGRQPRQDVSPEDVADARRGYIANLFADYASQQLGRG